MVSIIYIMIKIQLYSSNYCLEHSSCLFSIWNFSLTWSNFCNYLCSTLRLVFRFTSKKQTFCGDRLFCFLILDSTPIPDTFPLPSFFISGSKSIDTLFFNFSIDSDWCFMIFRCWASSYWRLLLAFCSFFRANYSCYIVYFIWDCYRYE